MTKESLRSLCYDKLSSLGLGSDVYKNRLEYELAEIDRQVYYPFIQSLLDHNICKRQNYNGLLYVFLLGISDEDPIKLLLNHKIFYEGSLPDIDVDVECGYRDQIVDYLIEKYGQQHVSYVGTLTLLKCRSCMLDVARQLNIPYGEIVEITKLIPEEATVEEIDISDSSKLNTKIIEFFKKYPNFHKHLVHLTTVFRQFGVHAGGVLVSSSNLSNICCLARSKKAIVTGWRENQNIRELEYTGLIKFDILGLITVRQVKDCMRQIGIKSISDIDLNDQQVYENILWTGKTTNIFQFLTNLGTDLVKKIKPTSIDELADISTMMRPGCLAANVPEIYHSIKFKEREYQPISKYLDQVGHNTFGLLLYQEQIMRLISLCSGEKIGLSKAEVLRRAIAKNDQRAIDQFKDLCTINGIPADETNALLKQIIDQGGYSFNKGHSIVYSILSYLQAYFKYYYPLEFWWSSLCCSLMNDKKDHSTFIYDAIADGVDVMPVDICYSDETFSIKDNKIMCGFRLVKGVGSYAADIMNSRNAKPFESIEDVLLRARAGEYKFNKTYIQPLIRIGAFLSLYPHIKPLEEFILNHKKGKGDITLLRDQAFIQSCGEYDQNELYDFEIQTMGFPFRYGQALEVCKKKLSAMHIKSVSCYESMIIAGENTSTIRFFGVITNIAKKATKKQPPTDYKVIAVTDAGVSIKVTLWNNMLKKFDHLIKQGALIVLRLESNKYGNALSRHDDALVGVDIDQLNKIN